ncbi:MAG: YihY/virulence factor BrkB family protein [Lachnospiraceae bacterium]
MYRVYAVLNDFGKELSKNNVSALAASAAFFIFLSLIPILMLISSVIPFTPITEADLMNAMSTLLPDNISPLAVSMVAEVYGKSPAAISIAAVITVWSAAKGLLALMRALNAISSVDETRHYLALRLRASIYTIIMLVIIVFFLFVMVFGKVITGFLVTQFPIGKYVSSFLMKFRFLYVWIILALLFAVLYTWLPNKRMKFRLQIPGAIFTSVVWTVFSWGFAIYVEHFNSFGIYGSLTTIIIVMLWLYFCMYIFMVGAEANHYFGPVVNYYHHKYINSRRKKLANNEKI